jgi:SNF2 family DNA or RNA helicase
VTPPLYKHQEDAVNFLLKRKGSGALFMDCGTGKTRATIEAYLRLRQVAPGLKLLIIAPLSLLNAAWREDVKKFSSLTFRNLHDEGIPDAWISDVWVMNYESFIVKRNFEKLHSYLYKHPVMLVCDESSRMKNHQSKTTKALIALRDHAKYRVILSGCPAPNSELEYWAQSEFVQRGLLHPSFFAFRNSYFHLARGKQVANLHGQTISRLAMREMMRTGFKYEITDLNRKRLMDRISPYCYWAKKDECLDLPETVDETREVELGTKQRKAYNEMKRHLITEISGSDITASVALTKLMKLRELASGFAFDEFGKAQEIGESAKLTEMDNLIEDLGRQPVIVWGNFHWEIEKLVALLSRHGEVTTLYSGTPDRDYSISRFQDGQARYLVANPHSAAHGLTFTNSSTEVFFSLDYSYESYMQAKARIHRIGQTNKCTYMHLVARDTIDQDIMSVLARKGDMNDILYGMVEKFNGVPA